MISINFTLGRTSNDYARNSAAPKSNFNTRQHTHWHRQRRTRISRNRMVLVASELATVASTHSTNLRAKCEQKNAPGSRTTRNPNPSTLFGGVSCKVCVCVRVWVDDRRAVAVTRCVCVCVYTTHFVLQCLHAFAICDGVLSLASSSSLVCSSSSGKPRQFAHCLRTWSLLRFASLRVDVVKSNAIQNKCAADA